MDCIDPIGLVESVEEACEISQKSKDDVHIDSGKKHVEDTTAVTSDNSKDEEPGEFNRSLTDMNRLVSTFDSPNATSNSTICPAL